MFSMCGSNTIICLQGSFRIDSTGDSTDVSGSVPNTVNLEAVEIEGGRTLWFDFLGFWATVDEEAAATAVLLTNGAKSSNDKLRDLLLSDISLQKFSC